MLDFYEAWRSVLIPILALAASLAFRRDVLRAVTAPLLIGTAGLVLTVLVTLVPSYMHHMPYGSLLLIALSGAVAVGAMQRWLRIAFAGGAVGYAGLVWIAPIYLSVARVAWTNLWGVALAATVLLLAANTARRLASPSAIRA